MRWLPLFFLGIAFSLPARSEDIVDVLRRSQQMRLEAMPPATDSVRVEVVRKSFEMLRQRLQPHLAVDLYVISGPVTAESLHGHIVIANESLADLAEGERVFILAHELGHVVSGHWLQMGLLYQRWIPGDVTPENTDPIAGPLGREASALAHRQEFEADAFALQSLKTLGRPSEDAFQTFLHQGMSNDTATHPGSRKRIASLRHAVASDTENAHAGLASEAMRP
jgi:Zn-dependent protease with chaperone function